MLHSDWLIKWRVPRAPTRRDGRGQERVTSRALAFNSRSYGRHPFPLGRSRGFESAAADGSLEIPQWLYIHLIYRVKSRRNLFISSPFRNIYFNQKWFIGQVPALANIHKRLTLLSITGFARKPTAIFFIYFAQIILGNWRIILFHL